MFLSLSNKELGINTAEALQLLEGSSRRFSEAVQTFDLIGPSGSYGDLHPAQSMNILSYFWNLPRVLFYSTPLEGDRISRSPGFQWHVELGRGERVVLLHAKGFLVSAAPHLRL